MLLACLLLVGRLVIVGCARGRKGEQAQNVENKIASRIEEKGTLFPFRRQDPFLCFFLLFFSFSDRSINHQSIGILLRVFVGFVVRLG